MWRTLPTAIVTTLRRNGPIGLAWGKYARSKPRRVHGLDPGLTTRPAMFPSIYSVTQIRALRSSLPTGNVFCQAAAEHKIVAPTFWQHSRAGMVPSCARKRWPRVRFASPRAAYHGGAMRHWLATVHVFFPWLDTCMTTVMYVANGIAPTCSSSSLVCNGEAPATVEPAPHYMRAPV